MSTATEKKEKKPVSQNRQQQRKKGSRKQREVKRVPRGYDEKLVVEKMRDVEAPGQRSTISHELSSPTWVNAGPIIAWASEAARRGYYAVADNPSKLYQAMAYAVGLIADAQNGVTPKAQRLPMWLLYLTRAFSPKSANIESKMSSESYSLQADWGIFPTLVETNSVYGYTWSAYVPTGALGPNGFPAATLPDAYDTTTAEESFASVCSFMASQLPDFPNHKMISVTEKTLWDSQMSAFAYPSLSEGTGFQGRGGIVYQSNLALPINLPSFGVFGCGSSTDLFFDATRYPQYTTSTSGDSISTGLTLINYPLPYLSSKRRTFYKPVDFLKIGEVAARWVAGVIQANFDGPVQQVTTIDPSIFQCPLTLQEFLLLIKNEVQNLFWTQTGVQSLYPAAPASSSSIQFVPYLNTPNVAPLGYVGMQLPMILVENIKSLAPRSLHKRGSNDYQAWVPILGQYKDYRLDTSEYTATATVNGQKVTISAFRQDSALVKKVTRRDSKGKDMATFVPEAETPIDFVDGMAGSSYIFINDQSRLRFLNEQYQSWVAKINQYSVSLTTVSSDMGSNILCSCAMTNYWAYPSPNEQKREEEVLDIRGQKTARLMSPYINQRLIATSSHARILGPTWGLAQNFWILPEIQLQSSSVEALATFSRMQDIYREGNSLTYTSTGDNGIPIVDRLTTYAQMLVKEAGSKPSELEIFFMDQHNRHGLLSSLAADLLGKALGPEAGAVAGSIASLFPI